MDEKEIADIFEWQKQYKIRQAEQKKRDDEELRKIDAEITQLHQPDPAVPDSMQSIIPSYDEFVKEMWELPDPDVGYCNAVSKFQSLWGNKGDIEFKDWNHYKDKIIDEKFKWDCHHRKNEQKAKVGDECYQKTFDMYRDYAKTPFIDTTQHIDQNVKGDIPIYRFIDIPNADAFVQELQKKNISKTTGIHWSWDLDKHRNIVFGRSVAMDKTKNADERDKIWNQYNFVFFRGKVTDPASVNIHDSVSSNMGELDHAEIRLKEDVPVEIDKVCIAHEYKDGWNNIRKEDADNCITFKKPIQLSTGSMKESIYKQK
jgi:hypothetical protein